MPSSPLAKNWRQPIGVPGINEPLPPGSKGLAIGPKVNKKLRSLLATFDTVRCVKEMAVYAQSAEDLRDAILAELSERGYVGPSVAAIVSVSCVQRMWSAFLSDRAAAATDEATQLKLIEASCRIADGHRGNILAAHDLHAKHVAAAVLDAKAVKDPLDRFDDSPPKDVTPDISPTEAEPTEP